MDDRKRGDNERLDTELHINKKKNKHDPVLLNPQHYIPMSIFNRNSH